MKAMILAAGLGTRLRPLTDSRPKALVEIAGKPLLEIVLERLGEAGVTEVIINLHHLGDQIESWFMGRGPAGMRVEFSREQELLDSGGGLAQARWFFDDDRPFLLHNVDVLSDIDIRAMLVAHEASRALATLAAKPRDTMRPLLFDETGALCGKRTTEGDTLVRKPVGETVPLGFCGIHVLSKAVFSHLSQSGPFSIINAYLALAGVEEAAEPVRVFRADAFRWRDAGRPEDLRPL